jgi:hypothetical protein
MALFDGSRRCRVECRRLDVSWHICANISGRVAALDSHALRVGPGRPLPPVALVQRNADCLRISHSLLVPDVVLTGVAKNLVAEDDVDLSF